MIRKNKIASFKSIRQEQKKQQEENIEHLRMQMYLQMKRDMEQTEQETQAI